jgi:hypothetical protein
MNMSRTQLTKFVIPAIVGTILLVSFIVVFGLASSNPDGFEWVAFDQAGIPEPEGGFEGIWAFLGDGPLVEVFTGAVGIVLVLIIGYGFFWFTSKRTETGST